MEKKRSTHRLSSLFSLGSNSEHAESGSVASSESSGRLSRVKNRITSATHLSPSYPPPAPPSVPAASRSKLTIQPVESAPAALAPLEPPPPIPAAAGSRPGSPSRSRPHSSAGRASTSSLQIPDDSKLRKLKRKSLLFGSPHGSPHSSNEHLPYSRNAASGPLAWVVGHKGKVEYNLTMLLNGEKVRLHSELTDFPLTGCIGS
jgi:hypothetical protein